MKKKMRKFLLTLSAALLLVTMTVGVTVAYLTDTETVTNTFTVGNVQIKLDEAKVDANGKALASGERVQSNKYHLLPNTTYDKDPTVTVEAGSEACYVRAFVEVSYASQIEAIANNHNLKVEDFVGGIEDGWLWSQKNVAVNTDNNTMTYEVWYNAKVEKSNTDTVLQDIFTTITMPGVVTDEELATLVTYKTVTTENADGTTTTTKEVESQLTISVTAQAIQADGFKDAAAAWEKW